MIYFYSGTPGSGKSLHIAEEIYHSLRTGKNVIANFSINETLTSKFKHPGSFIETDNFNLSVSGLKGFCSNFHKRNKKGQINEHQTLLVIDECSIIYDARTYSEKGRKDWVQFYQQHRKYGYDVVLISQFDRAIDRQIRALFEYEYKHRKINNFKFFGKILGLFSGGSLFCYVTYWYGAKERIGCTFFRGRRKFYNFFDSYKLFDGSGQS